MKLAQGLLNDLWNSAEKTTSHFTHRTHTKTSHTDEYLQSTALPTPPSRLGQGGGRRFFVRQKVPRQIIYNQHSHFDVYGCGGAGTLPLPKMY